MYEYIHICAYALIYTCIFYTHVCKYILHIHFYHHLFLTFSHAEYLDAYQKIYLLLALGTTVD